MFIFNMKDKNVGVDFKLSENNLDAVYKMTIADQIGKDELLQYATDENIKNLN